MKVNMSDFKYVLCPGSLPEAVHIPTYNKIYNCWANVWSEAFQELGSTKPFYSDSFTRQDYVGALFHKDTCFALAFFRWVEADLPDFVKDSYFFNWSPLHLKELCSRGKKIIVCSYFTVHPYGRGENLGVSGKELLTGLIVETFMGSNADGMTGAVRINKGVNKAGFNWGASLIEHDVFSGFAGANVDLIGFFKDHIQSHSNHELKSIASQLWTTRTAINRRSFEHEFNGQVIPLKKAV